MSDLSNDATDDGFHEIQLSGKQLVFLFMATTVVSVVIFLCGVLVGRGVRGEVVAATANKVSSAGPAPSATDTTPTTPPTVAEGTTPAQEFNPSYPERLAGDKSVAENLGKKPAPSEAPAPAAANPPVAPPPTPQQPAVAATDPPSKLLPTKTQGTSSAPAAEAVPTPPPSAPATAGSPRGVWAVQVVALTDLAAADAVVNRLKGKGYSAFLVRPQAGAIVKNYKVQVGRFDDRAEAQVVADRLKKEEQFVPWILR